MITLNFRQGRTQGAPDAEQIHIDNFLEFGFIAAGDGRRVVSPGNAGVGKSDIQPAKVFYGLLDHGF